MALCRNPHMVGAVPHGCGQCLPCRINRRRLWTWRMFYEAQSHDDNCFLTLTYSEEHVPAGGRLEPAHTKNFLKRLRSRLAPRRFRYFVVGEYGDESQRPHYHGCLFGVGPLDGPTIDNCWGMGFSQVAEFNEFTAQYCAGYVVKKLTSRTDDRLNGRHPEFARMSNRPGLGADAMRLVADQLFNGPGYEHFVRTGDVPHHLQIGRKSIPIGRYLRQRLRQEIGMPDEAIQAAKDIASEDKFWEMQALFNVEASNAPEEVMTPKQAYVKSNHARYLQIEARDKIKKGKKL